MRKKVKNIISLVLFKLNALSGAGQGHEESNKRAKGAITPNFKFKVIFTILKMDIVFIPVIVHYETRF